MTLDVSRPGEISADQRRDFKTAVGRLLPPPIERAISGELLEDSQGHDSVGALSNPISLKFVTSDAEYTPKGRLVQVHSFKIVTVDFLVSHFESVSVSVDLPEKRQAEDDTIVVPFRSYIVEGGVDTQTSTYDEGEEVYDAHRKKKFSYSAQEVGGLEVYKMLRAIGKPEDQAEDEEPLDLVFNQARFSVIMALLKGIDQKEDRRINLRDLVF